MRRVLLHMFHFSLDDMNTYLFEFPCIRLDDEWIGIGHFENGDILLFL